MFGGGGGGCGLSFRESFRAVFEGDSACLLVLTMIEAICAGSRLSGFMLKCVLRVRVRPLRTARLDRVS